MRACTKLGGLHRTRGDRVRLLDELNLRLYPRTYTRLSDEWGGVDAQALMLVGLTEGVFWLVF